MALVQSYWQNDNRSLCI